MPENPPGPLIVIGGHEEKEGERVILRAVAKHLHGRKLVLATVASREPGGYFKSYTEAFSGLGVAELVELYVNDRSETHDPEKISILDDAAGVFFSGGDQLRISSQIGDTPIEQRIRDIHRFGGLIAGTSAGASVMSETMLISGSSTESHHIGDLSMAPGLGFIRDAIIDQHFAERGRIGRLLGAVAHNPRILGVGIDENTAIILEGQRFSVIGSGAVYVVDGTEVTQSNIAEGRAASTLSLHDVRLHVLASGDGFDLAVRAPVSAGKTTPSPAFREAPRGA
jgi:cyanophycinase